MPGGPNTAQSLGDDGWRLTDSWRWRPSCAVGLGHCDVIMNVGKLTQAQTALRLIVAYLLHVLPCVALVRTFTRHCRSVISWWLVTTVTLLVAARHQFTRPAVGVCMLPLQRSAVFTTVSTAVGTHFSSPAPHPIHCSRRQQWMECRAGEDGCQPVPQSVTLAGFGDRFLINETGHHFEKRVPYGFTALSVGLGWDSEVCSGPFQW